MGLWFEDFGHGGDVDDDFRVGGEKKGNDVQNLHLML